MNHRPCCIIRSGGCDGKGFPCVGPDCWFWFCISCVGGTGAADDGSCCWDGMEADDDVGPSPCFEQKSPYLLILEVSHVSLILASAMKEKPLTVTYFNNHLLSYDPYGPSTQSISRYSFRGCVCNTRATFKFLSSN